ncbi:hypothetical protein KAU11_06370, partial [Candidatus Babeliales bacterium]|nr:hypothetical protein [Candidatus Babeliales bacterium]
LEKHNCDDTLLLYIFKALFQPFFMEKTVLSEKYMKGRTTFFQIFVSENQLCEKKDVCLDALLTCFPWKDSRSVTLCTIIVTGMYGSWQELAMRLKNATTLSKSVVLNSWAYSRIWFLSRAAWVLIKALRYVPVVFRAALMNKDPLNQEIMKTTMLVKTPKTIMGIKVFRNRTDEERLALRELNSRQDSIRALLAEK